MSRLPAVLELLRSTMAAVEAMDVNEQDVVYRAVLDHVRARRPESVGCLGQLPPPTERIVDPRSKR